MSKVVRFIARTTVVAIIAVALCSTVTNHASSQETGNEWTRPIQLNNNEKAWNPSLTVDEEGYVHAVWAGATVPESRSRGDVVFYSRWNGTDWTEPIDVLASSGQSDWSRPVIAAGPNRMLYLAALTGWDVEFSKAPSDLAASAQAWSTPRNILTSFESTPYPYFVDLKVDNNGALHLVAVQERAGEYSIVYSNSNDEGDNWSEPVLISTAKANVAARNPRLAIGADGMLHVSWSEVQLPDGVPPLGVYYSQSSDGGQTWSEPYQAAGEGYGRANVGIQGDSAIHLIWSGTVGYAGRFHRWSRDNGRTWSAIDQLPGIEDTFGGSFSEMTVDINETLHVVTGVEHQRYFSWTDGNWSHAERIADVDSDRTQVKEGGMPRIALSEGNRLIVLFHDNWNVFFTSKLIDAPKEPIPSRAEINSVEVSPDSDTDETTNRLVSSSPDLLEAQHEAAPAGSLTNGGNAPNPITPLVLGIAPAAAVVLTVMLLRYRKVIKKIP